MSEKRFTYIDALRGFAALAVVVGHFYGILTGRPSNAALPEPLHTIALHGSVGVHVFFVLSGFVIAYTVRNDRVDSGFLGRFALRRSLRLDPPYWVVIWIGLALMIASGSEHSGHISFWVLLANMFYLDNLLQVPSIVAVGWTLCLELQFYLVLVLLIGAAQSLSSRGLSEGWARLAIFAPPAVASVLFASGAFEFPLAGWFVPWWLFFFFGALVCWALERPASSVWLVVVMGLGLAIVGWVRKDPGSLVALVTGASIFLVGKRGALKSALTSRPLQFLGTISYSLYLIHPLLGNRALRYVVARFERVDALTSCALFAGALALCVGVSYLFYGLIEKPSLAWSRAIAVRRAPNAKLVRV